MIKSLLIMSVLLVGCNNVETATEPTPTIITVPTGAESCTLLFSMYSCQIYRLTIRGVDYIINTQGGIMKEVTK